MRQLSMLPEMGIFAIDASCIVGLDNKHVVLIGQQPATPEFTKAEQVAIWIGLEQLAANGRLKVIPAVASELRLRTRKAWLAWLSTPRRGQ